MSKNNVVEFPAEAVVVEKVDNFELQHFKDLIGEKQAVETALKAHYQFCAKKYKFTNAQDSINLEDGAIVRFTDEKAGESEPLS